MIIYIGERHRLRRYDDGFEGELGDAIGRAKEIADSLTLRAEALEVAV